jgi:hypothetical protein
MAAIVCGLALRRRRRGGERSTRAAKCCGYNPACGFLQQDFVRFSGHALFRLHARSYEGSSLRLAAKRLRRQFFSFYMSKIDREPRPRPGVFGGRLSLFTSKGQTTANAGKTIL